MRRLLVGLAAAGLVGLVAVSLGPRQSPSLPSVLAAPTKQPILGVVGAGRAAKLAQINAHSLEPLPGRRIALGGYVSSWSYSPDEPTATIALAVQRGDRSLDSLSLRLIDLRNFRAAGTTKLGYGWIRGIAWVSRDRVLVLEQDNSGRPTLLVVDPLARRVVQRRQLDGRLAHVGRTAGGLVALVEPSEGIGPTRVLVAEAPASLRSVTLERIVGGSHVSQDGQTYDARVHHAGLAVDPAAGVAYVVSPHGEVAEVGLSGLAVQYRTPSKPVSLLGRLHNWLEPAAEAKVVEGPSRRATWLGRGLIAVSGADYRTVVRADGQRTTRADPAGLHLIDTRNWSIHTVDREASWFVFGDGTLLATGSHADGDSNQRLGMGVAGYALDGSKRFHVLEREIATVWQIFGGRAYVSTESQRRPYTVIDLRSGAIAGVRNEPLPQLVIDPAILSG